MAKILDSRPLLRKFEKLERESRRQNNGDVNVGYTATYALVVHENLEATHRENQQAKYLEQPYREMRGELMRIAVAAMKGGASLIKGLLIAGLQLQRASQKIVPVDTGNLKGSAFTEKE